MDRKLFSVIGIGDNVVDKYTHKSIMYPGGNALNFAVYSKMLGVDSAYIGVFGDDVAAEHIKSTLDTLGIDIRHTRNVKGENGAAEVGLKDGDRVFLGSNKGGVSKENPIILSEEEKEYVSGFDLIHTSINSYIGTSFAILKEIDAYVSIDFSNKIIAEHIKTICPYVEFAIISVSGKSKLEIDTLISEIHAAGTPYVIATMGSEGSLFSVKSLGEQFIASAKTIEAVDTLGAGDAFIAAFLNCFLQRIKNHPITGDLIKTCMESATEFAAEICLKDGAFGYGVNY